MMTHRRWLVMAALIFVASAESGQGTALPPQAAAFMGTWVIDMTEPAELKGTHHTVRVWERNGVVAASLQIGRFPAREVTGVHTDGEMLVLTITHEAKPQLLENGAPLWAVISLTLDGDTMKVAQLLERSATVKRGTGKKQTD